MIVVLSAAPAGADLDSFLAGADVSFLPQVESGGGVYSRVGQPAGFFRS
jgi:hypothetical protein